MVHFIIAVMCCAAGWLCHGQHYQFPQVNIAQFGWVNVVDTRALGQRRDASGLATGQSGPVTVGPNQAILVEWTQPRDVRAVQLRFAHASPQPGRICVEWWRRIWPDNGKGGWMKLDDPFNGQWTLVQAASTNLGSSGIRWQFAPLQTNEAPGIKQTGFDYRRTYKLRISAQDPVLVAWLEVFTDAVEKRAGLRFEWDLKTTVPGKWAPRIQARNGRILKTESAGPNTAVVQVEYADAPDRLSADRGVVICRSGETRSFSVFVDDILRERGIYVRDIGAFVSDATKNLSYATWPGPPGEVWKEGTIVEQVAELPEQSFDRVRQAIPSKAPNYLFVGAPNLRQEIALGPTGDIILYANSLRSAGPDADRRPWKWPELRYLFASGQNRSRKGSDEVVRRLEEGWLPVVQQDWSADGIGYTETCVASTLLGDIAQLNSQTGTEPVVLAARFDLKNTLNQSRTAWLWLELNHALPMTLEPDGTLRLNAPSDGAQRPGLAPVRGRFNTQGKGELTLISGPAAQPNQEASQAKIEPSAPKFVCYEVELPPNGSHSIELAVPYIELLSEPELATLKSVSFARLHDSVVKFWKARIAQGMTYEAPDQFLNELFKANLWHVLVSIDIDPVTGQHQHGAATHHYGNFLNETVMVARSLEMRGEHEQAGKLIETFLANQGVRGLPGNFKSKEGVFYAAAPGKPDPYTAQGYNMHHGFGLWAAAEHYFWTQDKEYLRRVADRLVNGCDWITQERQATKFKNPDGTRPVEYGLAPAGDLEDVEEYLYFYATDAYYYLGMKKAAAALGRIGHPQARRLVRQTEAFLQDIRASVAESAATTPVVRLKDGTYVPYVPPRAYALTHLAEGWIRESLYPALHLVDAEVYPAEHPYVQWSIQDLEDNIFMSKESGFGVQNQKADFFNFGGFCPQPNLLNIPIAYLQRDQVPHFIRGFYNTAWASLYPDGMCFAEWVPAYGKGGGPLYKTPDESKFIQWMRQMLILERDDTLELGLGIPRAWMADGRRIKVERAATFFGKLDLEINSHISAGQVKATIQLRPAEKPRAVCLRLRHPEGKPIQSAVVNGQPARINSARQVIILPPDAMRWEVTAHF